MSKRNMGGAVLFVLLVIVMLTIGSLMAANCMSYHMDNGATFWQALTSCG